MKCILKKKKKKTLLQASGTFWKHGSTTLDHAKLLRKPLLWGKRTPKKFTQQSPKSTEPSWPCIFINLNILYTCVFSWTVALACVKQKNDLRSFQWRPISWMFVAESPKTSPKTASPIQPQSGDYWGLGSKGVLGFFIWDSRTFFWDFLNCFNSFFKSPGIWQFLLVGIAALSSANHIHGYSCSKANNYIILYM